MFRISPVDSKKSRYTSATQGSKTFIWMAILLNFIHIFNNKNHLAPKECERVLYDCAKKGDKFLAVTPFLWCVICVAVQGSK